MPQHLPRNSGLLASLPFLGCLSIILQLAASLQLCPREKSEQTTVETKKQVQSKREEAVRVLSISHHWEREGSKRRGIEKSMILSQGVETLLEKICCPARSRQGLSEGVC